MNGCVSDALVGGNGNNGTNAGFGCLNTNNRSSNTNANIGFRLYRLEKEMSEKREINSHTLTDLTTR